MGNGRPPLTPSMPSCLLLLLLLSLSFSSPLSQDRSGWCRHVNNFETLFLGGRRRGWNCIVPRRSCWQLWTDTRSPFTGFLTSKYCIQRTKGLLLVNKSQPKVTHFACMHFWSISICNYLNNTDIS